MRKTVDLVRLLETMDAGDRAWVAEAIGGPSFPPERVTLTTLRMLTPDQLEHLEERMQSKPIPLWHDEDYGLAG